MKITLLTLALACSSLLVNAQQTVKVPAGGVATKSLVKTESTTTNAKTATVSPTSKIPTTKTEGIILAEPKKAKAVTKKIIK
jgi:hypothetical protein